MRIESITSAQNPKIKELLALQEKSKERRKKGLFVVEGRRELQHCIEAEFEPHTLFVCRDILSNKDFDKILGAIEENFCGSTYPIIEISQQLYDKVAYRGGTEGIIAEMHCKELSLEGLKMKENPLVVILESVEKPGNLGAVGAIFTVPVATASSEDTIAWLKSKGIKIYTAQLQDSEWYYDTDMKGGTAIVMGTEATGLTEIWRKAADAHIKIPMLGRLDSLNVSVSAAILMFEAVRQRNS